MCFSQWEDVFGLFLDLESWAIVWNTVWSAIIQVCLRLELVLSRFEKRKSQAKVISNETICSRIQIVRFFAGNGASEVWHFGQVFHFWAFNLFLFGHVYFVFGLRWFCWAWNSKRHVLGMGMITGRRRRWRRNRKRRVSASPTFAMGVRARAFSNRSLPTSLPSSCRTNARGPSRGMAAKSKS